MKERKLTILLALLAALALVFAAGCESNGADGGSSENESNTDETPGTTPCCQTSGCTQGSSCNACDDLTCCSDCGDNAVDESNTVAGKKFAYAGEEIGTHTPVTAGLTYLASVELEFASAGTNTVDITVAYQTCTYDGSNHYTESNWTEKGVNTYGDSEYTWTASSAAYTYTAGADGAADTVTVTLPADSNEQNANATLTFTVDTDKLTLTGALTSGSETLSTYTVKDANDSDGSGCNILADSGVEGALTAAGTGGSEFELDNSGGV